MRNTLLKLLIFIVFSFFFSASLYFSVPKRKAVAPAVRSEDLTVRTIRTGNTEVTEYLNDGVLTYADDKHCAMLVKTTEVSETGTAVKEEYFDEAKQPAIQPDGHYGLLMELDENGRIRKTVWLDENGEPTLNRENYAILVCTYNEAGLLESEHYLDPDGYPSMRTNGSYGRRLAYEDGHNTEIVYLDEYDWPSMINAGYAILRRTFYEDGDAPGQVKEEFYFDQKDHPVPLAYGQYGLRYEYDDQKRWIRRTWLDAKGNPIMTDRGYSMVTRSYREDGSLRSERYYDEAAQPVKLRDGQYGISYVNGRLIYLDADGRRMLKLNQWLYAYPMMVSLIAVLVVILSILLDRKGNMILLTMYLLFIAYMTLMNRAEGENRANLQLFWSYRQFLSSSSLRLEILHNIWLFVPLGAILYRLIPGWLPWVLPFVLSALIEVIQYRSGIGLAEYDDIVSNTLGGILGAAFAAMMEPVRPYDHLAGSKPENSEPPGQTETAAAGMDLLPQEQKRT